MSWHLAPALAQLRAEVNKKWPNRSKASDGTIGDASHSARTSDHNPNSRRSVNAMDITVAGIDKGTLIAVAKKHPSVRYIISDRKIMNRDIGNFRARNYTGANPHTKHVHISLYQSATAENRTQSWGLANAKPVSGVGGGGGGNTYKTITGSTPLVKLYTKGEPVKRAQKAVGVKNVDGYWGPSSVAQAKKWQKANGLAADGMIGDKSWAVINGGKAKKPAAPKGDPFPLPKGHFYYTEDRRNTVHSGYWSKDRPAIRKIQKKVGTGIDGGYGNKTKAAVMKWQKKQGLKADGAVGTKTWEAMFG